MAARQMAAAGKTTGRESTPAPATGLVAPRRTRKAPAPSTSPTLLLAAAVVALALPSAVLAFNSRLDLPPDSLSDGREEPFAPGRADPRLTQAIEAARGGRNPLFRFTPAGLVTRPDRAVTVAVRLDAETARVITVRGTLPAPATRTALGMATTLQGLRIAPTAYNLGVSRGYAGFAQGSAAGGPGGGTAPAGLALGGELRHVDMPDLSAFKAGGDDVPGTPSRLAPHIALDERERAGRAPRTLESVGTQTVDLGGAYRVSKNVDLTASVRYQRDRDRLQPVIDGKTDSQAVFVGTQFRF